jgi:cytochrome c biogenesis protein CcdA
VIDAPLALAFTAGMVATVNPCGFAMLPAYLSYFLGIEGSDDGRAEAGVLRALVVGAVVSFGFAALFGVAGAIISWTSFGIERYASWVTIVIGIVLVAMGTAFIRGWEPRLGLPRLDKGGRDRGLWSMFVFGLSYAIASLSCAIGPFMTAVAGTFRRSNVVSGMAVFGAYALGMAVLLMALTVTLALARQSVLRGLRASLPYIQRISGVIMVITGAYLTWYGIYEIRVQGGDLGTGGPVDAVFSWSSDVQNWLSTTGAVRIGLVLGLLAAGAALVALLRLKPSDTADR